MVRCRRCQTIRTKGDLCPNADCPRNAEPMTRPVRGASRPVTVNVRHGFHAPTTETRLVSDYDLPIKARHWRQAGR